MEPIIFRQSLDLTRAEFAKQVGISESALYCIEAGTRFPEPGTMLKYIGATQNGFGVLRVTETDILRVWCRKNGREYPGANGNGSVSTRGAEEANPGDKSCRAKPKVRKSAAQVAGAKRQRKTKK